MLQRPPEHLHVTALSFGDGVQPPPDPAACRLVLEDLRKVVEREFASDLDELDATSDRTQVPAETGELGYRDHWDRQHLSVTVGISAAGYDALGVAAGHPERPADLVAAPWSQFGDTPQTPGDGHVLLHVNSDSVYVAEHVARRVEHTLRGRLTTLWSLAGAQRYGSRAGRVSTGEARALIGFHDGLSNLDPAHDPEHKALVFVDPDPQALAGYPPNPPAGQQPAPTSGQPGYGTTAGAPTFPQLREVPTAEPDSTRDGTYLFVRGSLFDTPAWDARTLHDQESAVGRFKPSGAFLDQPDDPTARHNPPAFAGNPADQQVPPGSHARRANPRSNPTDAQRQVFRRGYPMLVPGAGPLRRGLLFASFSRSLSTQIEFMLRAWLRNPDFPTTGAGPDPLMALDTQVLAGGYYFVPPLTDHTKPWTWAVPTP